MRIKLQPATPDDVQDLVALRAAVAQHLTTQHGEGPWSRPSTEKGVLFDMRNSSVFVARHRKRLVATLRLVRKKPWAIDASYFTPCTRPLYLLSMAVLPELQRQGIGRQCVKQAIKLAQEFPADAVRLDAYDSAAGAGDFYAKCGFKNRGHATYRRCPLVYFELLL
jgi:ribosomal protein S18 acetylase RimI-like enzyme